MIEGPRRPPGINYGREIDDNIESEVDERSASKLISSVVETTAGSHFKYVRQCRTFCNIKAQIRFGNVFWC